MPIGNHRSGRAREPSPWAGYPQRRQSLPSTTHELRSNPKAFGQQGTGWRSGRLPYPRLDSAHLSVQTLRLDRPPLSAKKRAARDNGRRKRGHRRDIIAVGFGKAVRLHPSTGEQPARRPDVLPIGWGSTSGQERAKGSKGR